MNMDKFDGAVNIGSTFMFTMLNVAEQIIDLTGSKSSIIYKECLVDDPTNRLPDIGKAKRLLDWAPTVEFIDGLNNTIEYYMSILEK